MFKQMRLRELLKVIEVDLQNSEKGSRDDTENGVSGLSLGKDDKGEGKQGEKKSV